MDEKELRNPDEVKRRINEIIEKENVYNKQERDRLEVLRNDPYYQDTPLIEEVLEILSFWYSNNSYDYNSYELIISARVKTAWGVQIVDFTDTYWGLPPAERISDVKFREDNNGEPRIGVPQ